MLTAADAATKRPAGAVARGESRRRHNAFSMSPPGSAETRESPHPFPLVTALVVTALGILAMIGGGGVLATRSGLSLRPQIALGTLALALPALAALALAPGRWPAVLGPRHASGRLLGLSALLGAALWVASAGLMEVQSLVAPPTQEYLDAFRAIHLALAPRNPFDAAVSILVIAVLPGLCEELVLRGVFLPSLAWSMGGPASVPVVLTALVFAAIHLDAYRFAFTFALGLVFGLLRLGARSLWPSVVAHLTLNTLTFAIAPYLDDPSKPYEPQPALGFLCLVSGAAVAWPLLRALDGSVDSPKSAS
jgi:membrane protease YdiL (CAAX protease family)